MLTKHLNRLLFLFLMLSGLALPMAATAQTTTTVISSGANPSRAGSSVSFNATVTSTAISTGTVQFFADGQLFGTSPSITIPAAGSRPAGPFSFTFSTAGPHTVTAVYSQTAPTAVTDSSDGSVNQVVKAVTSVAPFTVSPASSSTFGQTVTFTAQVAGGFGPATGSIQFQLDGNALGPPVNINTTGVATYSTSTLAVGSYPAATPSFSATYSGDSFNLGSSANLASDFAVNHATPTANLSASPNPSTVSQQVSFSIGVTGTNGVIPTGTVQLKDGGVNFGPALTLSNGTATFSTTTLAQGTRTITAVYSGDGTYVSVTSNTVSQQVNKATTSTTVSSSANPSLLSQTVTFTATVTSNGGPTPGGTVQFKDGGADIGGAQTVTGGQATFTTATLSQGDHTITAVYSGDTNNATSPSASLTQTVNKAQASISVSSLPNPSTFNTNVTFTATIPGNSVATPGGTVTFTLDGVAQSAINVTTSGSNGTASFSVSNLSVGNHSVTAAYSGDGNFTAATSSQYTQIVNGGATSTTALVSNNNPATFGQAVKFTATVTVTGGTATGTVTFKDTFGGATNTIGSGTLDGTGKATFTISNLAVAPAAAPHVITAVYAGDGTFNGSTSNAVNQVVSPAGTSVLVTSSSPPDPANSNTPTSTFGESVTFTATVTGSGGIPTGTVTFLDGTTLIGTGTLTPTGNLREASTTVTTSLLSVGSHTINANYGGDATNLSATGSLTQVVNKVTPSVMVTSDTNPSAFNQTVNFTAQVTATNGVVPTGTVQFTDTVIAGGTSTTSNIGAPQTLTNGSATLAYAGLAVGPHTITANYLPGTDATYNTASATLTQNVDAAASATALTSSSAVDPVTGQPTSTFNQSVTFTATVTGSGVTPTGTVTFKDGTATIGTGPLDNTGTATFSISTLSVGTHSITASYSGDTNYGASASTPPLSQNVNKGLAQVSLTADKNPSNFKDVVKFTAVVTAPNGGGTPTGAVTFLDGSTPIGNSTLDSTGTATFSTGALTVGAHSITATYSGDGNFATQTSSILMQLVKQSSSSVSVSASVNPSFYRQPVTYTVIVTGLVTPTGTVAFYDGDPQRTGVQISDPNNEPKLSPSGQSGQATTSFTYAGLSVGTHAVFAVYSGDTSNGTNFQSLTQTVTKTVPSVSVTSDKPQPSAGETITFTATVTGPAGGATPTGAVQFEDGTTNLGTSQPLNRGSATLHYAGLTVGSHTITAVYLPGGDSNYNGTQGTLSQTVFDTATAISSISPDHLLVPGTIRAGAMPPLKASDPQPLTITGRGFAPHAVVLFRNQTPGAALPIDGQSLSPDTISADGTTLTVTVPSALAADAGTLTVEVDNPSPLPNTKAGQHPLSINPVQALPTFPVGSAFVRMFSIPYDYTGTSPYDVLQGVTLSGDLTKGYDPDVNSLTGVSLFSDATQLPLYHWDPTLVDYLATVTLHNRAPDNLQFTLGQAYWVVGRTAPAALLGVMRLGSSAAFNPTGIPLQQGWNMVGDPFPADVPLANLGILYQGASIGFYTDSNGRGTGVSDGIVSPIFWSYDGKQYQLNYSGLSGHDQMRAYEGYWLYCYQPCTLLVTK